MNLPLPTPPGPWKPLPGLILALLATAAAPAWSADQLRSYAGVVAGNAVIGPQFQCATSGPTIRDGWFAGLGLPLEGIAACGLAGGTDDKIAAAGPLNSSFAASGPMATTGTYNGNAQARADYWSLGVAMAGTATGDSTSRTYAQAATFSSFTLDVTYSHPTIATGTPGTTDFTFVIDGMMQSLPVGSFTQQVDLQLGLRVNDTFIWDALRAKVVSAELPVVSGGSTGLPGSFVFGPGSLAGAAAITTTAAFQIVWGVPFKLEVALIGNSYPCCLGSSNAADFLNSATLAGIVARGPVGAVTDFTVATGSGPTVGPGGISPVPEPATWALLVAGLALVGAARQRNAASS